MLGTHEDVEVCNFRLSGIYCVWGSEIWKCVTFQLE
jgi:hypothetical protein